MNYLDEHPIRFDRPEVQLLRDLFVKAYSWPDRARELADSAGIYPGMFPINVPNMRTLWFQLVQEMASQGKLRIMVNKAANDPTIATYQPRFRDMLQESPALPAPAPTLGEDWWKGADRDDRVARKLHLERLMANRSRLIDIDIARKVGQVSRSVAKLSLRFGNDEPGYGTGFLIQPDRILTNHHNVTHEKYGDIKAMTVEFDYEPGIKEAERLVCQGDVASIVRHPEHDWAVIQLDKAVARQPIALGTRYDIGNNDPVIIIQHPLGAFKQFAIDPLSIQFCDEQVIQYLADTQKGSSGSPVFSIKMHAIALHHAEAEVDVEVNGRNETVWRNEGIRMDRVMEDLQSHGIEFINNKA